MTELAEHKIVYFPIPKVASTSLKHLFYFINTGQEYVGSKKTESDVTIHSLDDSYRSNRFYRYDHEKYADWTRIAVVRDPIKRVLSTYSNRVLQRKKLSKAELDPVVAEKLGIPLDPSIRKFAYNIDKYRGVSSSILRHTDPTASFLGPDLSYFHKVYRIEELGEMLGFLSERVGRPLTLPERMVSEKKILFEDQSESVKRALRQFCAPDYGYLRDYYAVR